MLLAKVEDYNSKNLDFGKYGLIGKLGGKYYEDFDKMIQNHFDELDNKIEKFFIRHLRKLTYYGINVGCIGVTGYIFFNSIKAMFFLNKSCKNGVTPLAKTYIGYFTLLVLRSLNAILKFKLEH